MYQWENMKWLGDFLLPALVAKCDGRLRLEIHCMSTGEGYLLRDLQELRGGDEIGLRSEGDGRS